MTELARVIGAISVVALVCVANGASAQVQGDTPGSCSVTSGSAGPRTGTASIVATDSGATLDFSGGASNSFGDSAGHGLQAAGRAFLEVSNNATCTYTLTSQNGALWNSAAGAVRAYTADAYDTGNPTSRNAVSFALHSGPATVSTFQAGYNANLVAIEFNVPATGTQVLMAGTYTDTLTLTVTSP